MIAHGKNIKIFAGNSHKELAAQIAQSLGLHLGDAVVSTFSDGEISVSGAEAAGWATVTLEALPKLALTDPLIENATHLGVIASAESLDAAADRAVHEMVDLICDRTGKPAEEMVMLLSLVADVQVCQMVDPEKTVRFMVPKYVLDALGFKL